MKKNGQVTAHCNQEWIRRFQQAKVPIPADVQRETLPVNIYQSEHATLFRIDPRRAGFVIPIRCAPSVPRSVAVEGFEVEIPIGDLQLQRLEDPSEQTGEPYYRLSVVPGVHEYHRDDVINHHFPGVLNPGRGWEGFLLGILWGQFPELLASPIEVKVVLFDDSGRTASAAMSVMVQRGIEYVPKRMDTTKRKGLFEPVDDGDAQEYQ